MFNRFSKITLSLGALLLIAFIAHTEARVKDDSLSKYVGVLDNDGDSDGDTDENTGGGSEGGITSTPNVTETTEGGTTSSPEVSETTEGGTTSSPEVSETTEGGTTSSPEVSETTEGGTTSSPEVSETTEEGSKGGTTSSPEVARTTEGGSEGGTTSSPEVSETTEGGSGGETTSSPKVPETTVPSTNAPISFTLYTRMTEEEFKAEEDEFKQTLAKVLNEAAAAFQASKFLAMFGAYAPITSEDISIETKQLDDGVLQLDITVKNTEMTADQAKKQVVDKKEEFNEIVVIEAEVPGPSGGGGLEDWEIALIVIGTLAGVAIIVGGVYYYMKSRRRVEAPMALSDYRYDNVAYN